MIMASLMVAPPLRDIVYDPDADSVMLLDWENARVGQNSRLLDGIYLSSSTALSVKVIYLIPIYMRL